MPEALLAGEPRASDQPGAFGVDVVAALSDFAEMVDQRLQFRRFSLSAAPRREARKRGFGLLVDMGQYRSAGVVATG